jgi:hypothetical protein
MFPDLLVATKVTSFFLFQFPSYIYVPLNDSYYDTV